MFAFTAARAALAGAGPRITPRSRLRRTFWPARRGASSDQAAEIAGARRRHPGRLRLRPDRSGREPLEDPGQRERQAPRFPLGAAGGRPQRDLRRAGRPPRGLDGVVLEDPEEHQRIGKRFDLTSAGLAGAPASGSRARGESDRADLLDGDAGRPRLARTGLAARRRPAGDRRNRSLQGRDVEMRAMVLAAGLGTRLRPITYTMPKPMVPVANRPVMEHILLLLARHGFGEAVANLHWFPDLIEEHFGDGSGCGVALELQPRGGSCSGPRAAVRNVGRLPRRRLPDHLRRRAHRHRPDRDARVPREPRRDRHAGDQAGRRTRASSASRSPTPRAGSAASRRSRTRAKRSRTSPTAASTCSARRSSTSSPRRAPARRPRPGDPDGFADWAMDVFPRLLEGDVPFYSHEIDAYWNDIGNLDGAARKHLRRAHRGGRGRAGRRDRRRLPQRRAGRRRGRPRRPGPARARAARSATTCGSTAPR